MSANHVDLQAAAERTMTARGFQPAFPPEVATQLAELRSSPPAAVPTADIRDLRSLPWSSIDNDTSRDLDQLEVLDTAPDGGTRVLVAIADVDAFVAKSTPIDQHAAIETTTVYTGVRVFPMLPDELSEGATSLLEGADKLAVVIDMVVTADGRVGQTDVYHAIVRNIAKMTYNEVGAWLEGRGPAPDGFRETSGLDRQIRQQDAVAQTLRAERHRHGALNIETVEARPIMRGDQVTGIARETKNRATALIEDFMIAANGTIARFLESKGVPSIRRVVTSPKRWDRIVALAASMGATLPATPDAPALNAFLCERQAKDPDRFPDLSLAVIKLLGPGEYVLERPGEHAPGHFGLAVDSYTHSTAPNRRFADLVTQRLVKAALTGRPAPYSSDELATIATVCTLKEDAARKVERAMSKRIAALAMSHRIGETFDAIVTGVTPHGTFVRVLQPPLEGLLVHPPRTVDVGDRLRVRLVRTDVEQGYIDFAAG
jgi:exoribonuclease-2